jgi:hypothetical protein
MVSLADYFKANRYNGKRQLGERVTGVYKGIRWMGSIGNDTMINETQGPVLHILLDLPLKVDGVIHHILVVKHKDVKPMKVFD